MLKKLIGKFYINKARKLLIHDIAELIKEIPKINTVTDCLDGYRKVGEFAMRLSDKNEDQPIKQICGNLIAYLTDTKEHIERGFHKPEHNGWNTITHYPDINDYINLGVRINTF